MKLCRKQHKIMSKQTNDKPAQDAAQTAPEIAATVSKETMERHQQEQAKAIGCDEKKTVSGFEYLLILIRAMVKEGIIPAADLPRAASMARGMKANNSALRQWLYERPEEKQAVSKIAEKYLSME
jgi:hypothetical protein